MPRARVDILWRERVAVLMENDPKMSSQRITDQLRAEAANMVPPRDVSPSESAIRNIMREHRDRAPEVRAQYRWVRWPESFGTPDLPWEAGRCIVTELLPLFRDDERPTVRFAKWFWRVSQVWPEAPAERRLEQSALLLMGEAHAEQRPGG